MDWKKVWEEKTGGEMSIACAKVAECAVAGGLMARERLQVSFESNRGPL